VTARFGTALSGHGRRRIGLLGGSFNPAHSGHLHISRIALSALALDAVWWLVSPQNPLKSTRGMAPFAARLAQARALAAHPRIRVSDFESRLGSRYTFMTLGQLKRRFPRTRFVWIMGADNLRQISRWRQWERIFTMVPIAVFDRPGYSLSALAGLAAQRFRRRRRQGGAARRLAEAKPPAWTFIHGVRHPASATALRASSGRAARPI
jgi:nicotinate-nucleotide adenylyltransferase